MGGRLEKAEEVGVPDELPKPDWMIEIDKEDWNDEQRKQGREFENKAKVYREELAKRRRCARREQLARRLHRAEAAETVDAPARRLAECIAQLLHLHARPPLPRRALAQLCRAHHASRGARACPSEERGFRVADAAAASADELARGVFQRASLAATPRVRPGSTATRWRRRTAKRVGGEFKRDCADPRRPFERAAASRTSAAAAGRRWLTRVSSVVSSGVRFQRPRPRRAASSVRRARRDPGRRRTQRRPRQGSAKPFAEAAAPVALAEASSRGSGLAAASSGRVRLRERGRRLRCRSPRRRRTQRRRCWRRTTSGGSDSSRLAGARYRCEKSLKSSTADPRRRRLTATTAAGREPSRSRDGSSAPRRPSCRHASPPR